MNYIVVFDTEFLTDEDVQERNWRGIKDPPPFLVQIGAYKLNVDSDLTITDSFSCLVKPYDRENAPCQLSQYFQDLTGISQNDVDADAIELEPALKAFKDFIGDAPVYSFGLDIEATFLISCYIKGLLCPVPIAQGHDIRALLVKAGIEEKQINALTSGVLAQYLGVSMSKNHRVHDARDDAMSLALSLKYLVAEQRLSIDDIFRGNC